MSEQPKPKQKFHKAKLKPSQAYQELSAKRKEIPPSLRIAKLYKEEDKAIDEALQNAWLDCTIQLNQHLGVNPAYALPTRHDFYD